MFYNQKGFSLIQVLVASAILGGLSLTFMRLMGNMQQAQNSIQSKGDETELYTSIRMILENEKFCRVSLAGNGNPETSLVPITFEKKDIDDSSVGTLEGLDVSLYLSNQEGDTRTLKKFNGADNVIGVDKHKFGSLSITSLRLIMNNPTTPPNQNYGNGTNQSDTGIIRVYYEKKVSSSQTRELFMDFDVRLSFSTGQAPEGSGVSRILSCSRVKDEAEKQYYFPYSFGGMYSIGCGQQINPVTGGYFCPANFSAIEIYFDNFSCWDNVDASIFLCIGGEGSLNTGFGGIYSTGTNPRNNPITGAANCPAGFTSSLVYFDNFSAWDNLDTSIYLCHSGPVDSYRFYGLYQSGNHSRLNPLISREGCPPGTSESSVFFDDFVAWDNLNSNLVLCHD